MINLLFQHLFSNRAEPRRIRVGVNENGETLVYLPGCTFPVIVKYGLPLEIEICGHHTPEVIQMQAAYEPQSSAAGQPPA